MKEKPMQSQAEGEAFLAPPAPAKRKRFGTLRAAIVAVLAFTLLCGILYPIVMTAIARTAFPFEANGSVVTITRADGTQVVAGSELMGQGFDKPYHLFGRVNRGAPTNQSPVGETHQENMAARLEYLRKLGYTKDALPANLITTSGSGVDPHIAPQDAEWQVEYLAKNRFAYGWRLVTDGEGNVVDYIRLTPIAAEREDAIAGSLVSVEVLAEPIVTASGKQYCGDPVVTPLWFAPATVAAGLTVVNTYDATMYEAYVRSIVAKYTTGRWLGIFGEPTVNVLYVNLALDGLL